MLFHRNVKIDGMHFEYNKGLNGYALIDIDENDSSVICVPPVVKSHYVKVIGNEFLPVFSGTTASVLYLPSTIIRFGYMSFADSGIRKIIYSGTLRQWQSIGGKSEMHPYRSIDVECTDGVTQIS